MEKVDKETAVIMQKVAENVHILTTAIPDGLQCINCYDAEPKLWTH